MNQNQISPKPAEAANAVNDIIAVRWWRDRYKTALEGIAGFPIQLFDEATPLRMRDLAEHALAGDFSENADVEAPKHN